MVDTELSADEAKYSINTFENIEWSIQKLDGDVGKLDIISWLTVLTTKEDQLRKGGKIQPAGSAINSTNISNGLPGRIPQNKSQSDGSRSYFLQDNSSWKWSPSSSIRRHNDRQMRGRWLVAGFPVVFLVQWQSIYLQFVVRDHK